MIWWRFAHTKSIKELKGILFVNLSFFKTAYRKRWLIDDFRPQVIVIWFSGNRYQALQRSIVAWLCICGCFGTKGQISKQFWQFFCFLKMTKVRIISWVFACVSISGSIQVFITYFHDLNYCNNYFCIQKCETRMAWWNLTTFDLAKLCNHSFGFSMWIRNLLQLNEYEAVPYSLQLNKPKLYIWLFVNFCVFTCFYQFLHDGIIILFCFLMQSNVMITSCKNW